ncbi:MAG: acyltransferase [Gloeobacteraceae cyanobacterium ES-bin-144]|nr:acyltransferase [Verrucomicrobiales bacterium]
MNSATSNHRLLLAGEKSFTGYRPDIDGLRAIAILGVLLYHIDHLLLGGGFVGVDVFFVISGFLITSLMAREIEAGRFTITQFYERRIRRIFPALFCMIVGCCVATWFMLLPADMTRFATSVKYVAISIPNLYFLEEIQDYFSPAVSQLPMLHTWSLGVEEQFYFVFPLVLTSLYRYVRNSDMRLTVIAAVFIVSFTTSCIAVHEQPAEAFFLLPYRAWEMMLGSLLAMTKLRFESVRWNHVGGVTGLLMILASMAMYTEETAFPGLAALAPCMGTGLLILSGADPRTITARLLSCKPLVFVGLISYSVYLWHWPLLVFAQYRGLSGITSSATVFVGSLVAGTLSWRFIEQPFRKTSFGKRRAVFAGWAISCVILICFWHAARVTHGFSKRYSTDVLRVLEFKNWATGYRNQAAKSFRPEDSPVYGTTGVQPDIALWGDSHARALLPVLDAMAKTRGRAIKHFGMNGVPPVLDATPMNVKNPTKVSKYNARTLEILTKDPSLKTVILISRWNLANQAIPGIRTQHPFSFHERAFDDWNDMESYYAAQIQKTVRTLLAAGKKVVIIEPIPAPPFNVPDKFAKNLHNGLEPEASISFPDFARQQKSILDVFDRLEPSDRLVRIRPRDKLISDGQLLLWFDRQPLFADQNHLSTAGAFFIKELLADVFTH